MVILGDNRAAETARMALMMAALEPCTLTMTPTQAHLSDDTSGKIVFSVRPKLDYPKVELWRYDEDLPNLIKHRETCAKNRKKRKAKRKHRH